MKIFMKIKYRGNILARVRSVIIEAAESNVELEYIQLTENEYIQFLEEVCTLEGMLIKNTSSGRRVYQGVELKVVP